MASGASAFWMAACLVASGEPRMPGAEIVYADGRRVEVADPRQDSQGRWLVTQEGRRVALTPGEVVAILDDAGQEIVIIPALVRESDPPQTAALLASLAELKNATWAAAAEQLALRPSQGVLDELTALASSSKKELRRRAISALSRLRTRESVLAATRAVLAEKDPGLRRDTASVLFSVQEIFRRSETAELLEAGIQDRDSTVRLVFALLASHDFEAAIPVLKADGLKSSYHHDRESAALELGRRGDSSGESILVGMLARDKLPGFDGGDALMETCLIQEQVEVCRVLGKLGSDSAKAALKKATASRREAVRKAAADALAAAG